MTDLAAKLQKLAGNMATFTDTFEVRTHLAKKEAQDAWQSLEPVLNAQKEKLNGLVTQIKASKDESELQVYLGMKELADKMEVVTSQIDQLITAGKADVKTGIDTAKLKADLAAMDAEDFLKQKRSEFEKAYAASKVDAKTTLSSAMDKISKRFETLTK